MVNTSVNSNWISLPISCAGLRTIRNNEGECVDIHITQVNDSFAALTGENGKSLYGKSLLNVFPDINICINDYIENISSLSVGNSQRIDFFYKKNNSSYEINIYCTSNDEYMAVVSQSALKYPSAVSSMQPFDYTNLNSQLFGTIVSSISDGIIATDKDEKIIFINHIAADMTEWDSHTVIGMHINSVFSTLDYKTRNIRPCPFTIVRAMKHQYTPDGDSILVSRLGMERTITYTTSPVVDANHDLAGFVLTFRDITLEKQKLEAIEFLSYHDVLTGLYNRSFFETELRRLDTQRNYPLSVVVADLNSLKLINDAFGHSQGDSLLRKAGEVLKCCCRVDDIIARIGGDEFVLLLPKTNYEDAGKIVERIEELCKQTTVCSINLSISFGWDTKSDKSENIKDTKKRAENNMYRKKLFESTNVKGNTVKSIISELYGTHSREEEHSRNVSRLCELIGREMGMSEINLKALITASLMHDIGKIAINSEIEKKLDPLTVEDWMDIKRHPEIGYRILSSVNDMANIAESVLSHHERWDGRGYPRGLSEENIPLYSRIIAIADAYDAMTSNRAFRHNMSSDEALQEIMRNAGTQFDPTLAELFKKIYTMNMEIFETTHENIQL